MKVELPEVFKFSEAAHQGQTRKYTGIPYIEHPVDVYLNLGRYVSKGLTLEMKAAALLHDTVEDTDTTILDIRDKFGSKVSNLVYWLTDQSKPEDGNRAERKEIDRHHIAKAPDEAQIIKLADLISNSEDIVEHDKKFAVVYLKEQEALLDVMSEKVKESEIFQVASELLIKNKKELGLTTKKQKKDLNDYHYTSRTSCNRCGVCLSKVPSVWSCKNSKCTVESIKRSKP